MLKEAAMQTALLNDELSVGIPNGFHVMDHGEEIRVFQEHTEDRWAIWDTQRRIIISVMWHVSNKFLVRFASTKDLIQRVEKKARKAYAASGYQAGEPYETQVCGTQAHAIRYEYEIGGVAQVSEVLIFKHETSCYTVYYYARKNAERKSRKVFQQVLDSMELQ